MFHSIFAFLGGGALGFNVSWQSVYEIAFQMTGKGLLKKLRKGT